MRPVPGQTFEALQERGVDPARAKLVDELVIVDRELLAVARNGSLDVPGRHDLLVCRRWIRTRPVTGFRGTPQRKRFRCFYSDPTAMEASRFVVASVVPIRPQKKISELQ